MRITTLLSAAAIALAATIGSVSAADQFATLDGVSAASMSSGELAAVKGQHVHFLLSPRGTDSSVHAVGNPADTPAAGNGVVPVDESFFGPGVAGISHSPVIFVFPL